METDKTDKTDRANFYTSGMTCREMDDLKRKRGTKVPRTERRKAELMIRRGVISSTHNARAQTLKMGSRE